MSNKRTRLIAFGYLCAVVLLSAQVTAQEAAPAPAPAPAPPPPISADTQQVNVSVKIVEFQTSTGVETGLSAYFKQRNEARAWGRVTSGNGNVRSADITFPMSQSGGLTVFLDNIVTDYGDIEVVLQALVDQNRAFILSQPKAMVTVGGAVPTTIKTTQQIPYEDTKVVGATAVQTTDFRATGVDLTVSAPQFVDDDGNLATTEDTYVQLAVTASVIEEGQRIVVALASQAEQSGAFSSGSNAIQVPELVSRSVTTTVWVRHGQVLLLGGLYRNTKNKKLSTLPWLTQGEDMAAGLVNSVLPSSVAIGSPLSASVGNRSSEEGRRELVFLIKAELWRPSYSLPTGMGTASFGEETEEQKKMTLKGVVEGITEIPQGIVEGITSEIPQPEVEGVKSHLGGEQ